MEARTFEVLLIHRVALTGVYKCYHILESYNLFLRHIGIRSVAGSQSLSHVVSAFPK